MRIVLDLQACQASNRHRGIGRYSMSLAKAFARQSSGHDLRIILNSRFPESVAEIRAAFDGLLPQAHIAIFDVPPSLAEIDPANAWRTHAAERVREAFLAGFKPNFVHVASLFEGLVDDAVSSVGLFNSDFSTAATLYDLIPLLRKDDYLQDARVKDWYYRKLQALKNTDLLLAISGHSRQEAIDALHLPQQRVINISGAADDCFRPQQFSRQALAELANRVGLDRPFVMYTGGIDKRKNIDGLIEAYAQLPADIRLAHQLAIVCKADDTDQRRLLALAAQAGLGERDVVFTGYVCDEDLVALYNACTLFVFPSLHEGFGLPALEAMSCGAAVIGSNNSSVPEVIGRADALFDPTDTSAIARKMHQALSDGAFRESLKAHGLAQARHFSWDASAQTALKAIEESRRTTQEQRAVQVSTARRPRLAYLSPLPPAKSGIADYSAELVPELARYYDIEIITDDAVADPMVTANFPQRSVAWFDEHAARYDRILYHFGNSSFHQHMFELLERHPGVVVLHDFFLSSIIAHMDVQGVHPHAFPAALYRSHGYTALLEGKADWEPVIWKYPCNKRVLDCASGVIVHSQYSKKLARQWYNADTVEDWRTIPLLRAFPSHVDRAAARRRLGIADEDFVICSFGILGPTKLNDRLLNAWLESPLAKDRRCHLIFVGHNDKNPYCRSMDGMIARAQARHDTRVRITGFVTAQDYRDYLAAADVAVQLRSLSRGETSASILDCLAHGLPTIINANGAAEELPDDVLVKLADQFDNADLSKALTDLWKDAELRASLSHRAVNFVRNEHHPAHVGCMYYEAIEDIAANARETGYRVLIGSLSSLHASVEPTAEDLTTVAECIASNRPRNGVRQMFIDISELVQRDAKSGIQRVVRNILSALIKNPPANFRIEPVYEKNGVYLHAREFTARMFDLPRLPMADDPIESQPNDVFLGLDLNPAKIPDNEEVFIKLRNRGVAVHFVVYDVLPVLRPDVFVAGAKDGFNRWLGAVSRVADGLVCISRAVADELIEWIDTSRPERALPLKVGYFHLGADIAAEVSENSTPISDETHPVQIKANSSFLMVGTLEPRKGHAHALSAFEQLWAQGTNANLVIVGKQGWMVEELVERLRQHPENGKHLFWYEAASDETLLWLYGNAAALLAASEAEGFGLPLIEAAQHHLPLIVRDIPVFREVADEHAFYFSGTQASELAAALQEWMQLHVADRVPNSAGMRWLTWAESAEQLLHTIERESWYCMLPASANAR